MNNIIDTNKVKYTNNKGYSVRYHLYHEDDDKYTSIDEAYISRHINSMYQNENNVCFAGLRGEINSKNKYNRLAYVIQDKKYNDKLTAEEKEAWINISKENKFLPDYIDAKAVATNNVVVVKIEKDISPSLLYVYLTTLRKIQENQCFVRSMLELVNTNKILYVAAWIVVSKLTITNTWHNIVNIGRGYGDDKADDVNKICVDISPMIGLYRYINNPGIYDTRKFSSQTPFNASDTILKISNINRVLRTKDLFDKNVVAAIQADTDEEVSKYLTKFEKKEKRKTKASMA